MAAQGSRKGLAGAVQDAILKFLEVFLAILMDFRAGRLGAVMPQNTPTPALPHRAEEREELSNEPGAVAQHSAGARVTSAVVMVGCAHPTSLPPEPGGTGISNEFATAEGPAPVEDDARTPCASPRPRRFRLLASGRGWRLRELRVPPARWRDAPGMRRAFPPCTPPCRAGPGRGGLKNGPAVQGICVPISLRNSNDIGSPAGLPRRRTPP